MSAALAAFFVRRERWTLTWTGRLLTLAGVAMLTVNLARGLCGFLAITSPVGGQFLVVEGWMPTYAYREAVAEFRKGSYRKIIAAGVLQEDGNAGGDLREHFGGEKLIQFGVPSDLVVTASYGEIHQDRTFHSAMAVKQWLQEQGLRTMSIDVVTVGPHARRSRLLYEKALGNEVKVGVISVEDRRFDPNHWWRSSEGVRTVVDESIAYLYARIFFSPPQ
jgi:uncharacterized SAM-binding protein YcdF (DUF218 family)